jgi:predicted ATPase
VRWPSGWPTGSPTGVWLAELAGVADPGLVPAAVAVALGIQHSGGGPVLEALADVLAARQALLVLDNCEHLIDAVAGLCGTLLPAADDVRILATSREPARVGGEARYRLPPLGLPEPGQGGEPTGRRRWPCSLTGRARRTRISP